MLFNSIDFLIFFPVVVLVYYIIPDKVKHYWLLISSYYFYMCWNAKYAILIFFSTLITYLSGLLIDYVKRKSPAEVNTDKHIDMMKIIVAVTFVLELMPLFFYKYFNFSMGLLSSVFGKAGIALNLPVFDVIIPVGISFYTFQALSYTMDVYRDEVYAEKNFFRYALFVSFFPQLVAGPIERSKNLLIQLAKPAKFNYEKARSGLMLMLWGFFLKLVLADRIAIFVDCVYNNYSEYTGFYIITATVLFAFQIYCDFYGYSIIAKGAALILGIELMENFSAPYLNTDVANFWRGWHISLTTWFKDYLYIPLGGSRKGKIRKYFNKIFVFLVSGLWHGASLSYVVWGGLNGLYQVIGEALMPVRNSVTKLLHLNRNSYAHKLAKMLVTFILVDFSWLFFRAGSMGTSVELLKSVFTADNMWILFDGSIYECGLDSVNFSLMIICLLILAFADICKKRGIVVHNVILEQDYWFRYLFIALSIVFILVFGIWGTSYNAANFIYFQF